MNRARQRDRTKDCDRCSSDSSVLYRVQYDDTGKWRFICSECLPAIKNNNPLYTYGGTWKARKSR